ncbi:MAG TPA: HAD family hydrolase [Solirubrobacteraceae bacterium]|nr:HAD family hydrolase [Solirubrobacteraceae bacterium]
MTGRLQAVFLDRDGTINVKAPEGHYITRPEQLTLLPGAAEGIRMLNDAGVPVVVVTNQRGVALGRMNEADLRAVHVRLRELLRDEDAWVDAIFYCPHDVGTCACRKPSPLMLRRAGAYLGLTNLRHTVMIGDSSSDEEAGRNAGARTVLLGAHRAPPDGSAMATTLLDAVRRELLLTAA